MRAISRKAIRKMRRSVFAYPIPKALNYNISPKECILWRRLQKMYNFYSHFILHCVRYHHMVSA